MKHLSALLSCIALTSFCSTATAVDTKAGEATFKAQCAECHYVDDFAGESAANLIVLITEDDTLAAHEGKADLKALSPEAVASLAEYLATAR